MLLPRDADYYREDGDLVVQAEETLFRIDKGVLKREHSAFADMFVMPHPDGHADGEDNEHPLILHGDTVEEFRALCWIGCILPGQTPNLYDPETLDTAQISRLLSLAIISHKYEFSHLENWAYTFVAEYSAPNRRPSFARSCSSAEFDRLLHYATISARTSLLSELSTVLVSRMNSDPPTLKSSEALRIGEKYQWLDFQAEAYYRIACQLSHAASKSVDSEDTLSLFSHEFPTYFFPSGLTADQRSKAMHGYICLSVISDRAIHDLLKSPQPIVHSFSTKWVQRSAVDIIGRLQEILSGGAGTSHGIDHMSAANMLVRVKLQFRTCLFGKERRESPSPQTLSSS